MLRRYLYRTPRFGLLTVFAAMLLFVSAAGWFRFQYDLYQEEEAVVTDLTEAGCQVIVHRHDLVSFEGEPFYQHWLGVPYFDRVQTLSVYNSSLRVGASLPRDLIERAARLPFLESFDCPWGGTLPQRYPDRAPIPAPPRPEAAKLDVEAPLPSGEVLDRAEADELFRAWKAAWASPSEMPYGALRIRDAEENYGPLPFSSTPLEHFSDDVIVAYGPGGSMHYLHATLDLTRSERTSSLDLEKGKLVERKRYSGELADYRFDGRAAHFRRYATGRSSFEFALQALQVMERKAEFVDPTTNLSIAKAYRLDDGRCRMDFAPIAILREDGTTEDKISLSALFMEADDYPLEAFDLVVNRTDSTGVVPPSEMLFRWRGALSRHADRYLVDAAVADMPIADPGSPSLPLQHHIEANSIAYDLTPPPDSAFDPAVWNAIEFPDPRPLPVWRWYYATFAISVALLAFAAGRKVAERFRGKPSRAAASEPIDAT